MIKKDIVILSFGKVTQVLLGLVSIKILTVILSEEEVGNYYLLLTILTLLNFTFLNPLGQYFSRHLIHWQKSRNLLNATVVLIGLRLFAIIFSLSVAYGIYEFFGYDRYYSKMEFLLFLFISLLAGTHGVLLNAVNILGDRIVFTRFLIMTLITSLVFSLLITIYNKTAIGWLYGVAIAQLAFSYILYRNTVSGQPFDKERIVSIFRMDYIVKVAVFIVPVSLTLFLQWGQNTSYRFIVEAKYSIETLAFIGVGVSIAAAVFGAVESLAAQYYNPIYLRKITGTDKEERAAAWNELASYMIPIYVLLAFLIISIAPYLSTLLVAEKFFNAYVYTIFGVMLEFFRVMTGLIYLVSQSEVKTGKTILPYGVGFTLTVVLLYLFDFTGNLWIIPLVLGVTQAIIMVLLFVGMKKLLEIRLDILLFLKPSFIAIPLLGFLLIEIDKTVSQALLITIMAGCYFLMSVYLIVEKDVLRIKR